MKLIKRLAKDIANMTVWKLANATLPSEELYGTENGYFYADSLIFSNIFSDFLDNGDKCYKS